MNVVYQVNSIIWNVIDIFPIPLRMIIASVLYIYIIKIMALYMIPVMARVIMLVLYLLASAIVSLIILPEYIITSKRRQNGSVIYGTYSQLGAILEVSIQKLYELYIEIKKANRISNIRVTIKKCANIASAILAVYLVVVWLTYPIIMNQETKDFAGKSLALWCSFEDLNLNRTWTPLSITENQVDQRIYHK